MVCILLANGFEMIEALTPCDVLKRAGATVKLVSITDTPSATSTHGVTVGCDMTISELDPEEIELLILPGGMPGAQNLYDCEAVCQLTVAHAKKNKPIAAICAAPFILGKLGLLKDKRATCYPSMEDELCCKRLHNGAVCVDGNYITSKSAGTAMSFAIVLVKELLGDTVANNLKKSIVLDV
jgi:4-methyl-5(b-hydroxyethyl)-thiazole monophosphate biosynthesis